MKYKLILGFVLIITILTAVVLPCYASNTLSDEEAGELIKKAVDFNDDIHWNSHRYFSNTDSDEISIQRSFFYYRGTPLGEHYCTNDVVYYLVKDESLLPGGSYENLSSYAKTIFTDDISEDMYNTMRISFYSGDIPMFHVTDDGQLYMGSDAVAPIYVTRLDNRYDDVVDVIYSDDQKATVRYLVNVGFDKDNPVWIECYMINTADGWRIAKSPFTDMLRHEWDASEVWEPYVIPYTDSPSTADPAVGSFVILPVISLACLVPAVCLLRRRRRAVA